MILIMKKSNIMLGVLIVALALGILGVNLGLSNKNGGVKASTVATLNTKGKVVVIDAGHGGEDPGATSTYSGAKEKDLNLSIAFKLKELLEKAGYKVIMTRTEDVLVYEGDNISNTSKRRQDLINRKKIMDESKADVVISIHMNGFKQTKYSGAQTFYTKNSPSSKKLAISIQDALRSHLDSSNKREALLKADDIIITKDCKVTTVIVECGFLSNEAEEKKLIDPAYQSKLAEAIKLGIDKYFTVNAPAPSPVTTKKPK